MDGSDIQQILLRNAQLRVESEMAQYINQQLGISAQQSIPVIGGDARTGLPKRLLVTPAHLQRPAVLDLKSST